MRFLRFGPMPDDCTVRLVDMPVRQGGMISEDVDGHVNVYLNARLSSSSQGAAFFHEMDHAEQDDLRSDRDIRDVEQDRDRLLKPPLLVRARDLLRQPQLRPAPVPRVYDGWQDDMLHRMAMWE